MHTIVIAADRAATARKASLVLHLFDLGHALLVEQMAALGVRAPARFMAGDETGNDLVDEEDDAELEDVVEEEPLCPRCNGSGEGMYDGATCGSCRGSGVVRDFSDEEDRLAAEADHLYDVAKDERAERGGA